MTIRMSRTYHTKVLAVFLIVVLLLETVETRPHKKAKRKNRRRNHTIKQCGMEGHICQPGSRKLCCASGFTCKVPEVPSNWTKQQKANRPRIGTCQAVPTLGTNNREIDERNANPNPSFRL